MFFMKAEHVVSRTLSPALVSSIALAVWHDYMPDSRWAGDLTHPRPSKAVRVVLALYGCRGVSRERFQHRRPRG